MSESIETQLITVADSSPRGGIKASKSAAYESTGERSAFSEVLDRQGSTASEAAQKSRDADAAGGKGLPEDRQADRQERASVSGPQRGAAASEGEPAEAAVPVDGELADGPRPDYHARPLWTVATAPPAEPAGDGAGPDSPALPSGAIVTLSSPSPSPASAESAARLPLDPSSGDGARAASGDGTLPTGAPALAGPLGEAHLRPRNNAEGPRGPVIALTDSPRPEVQPGVGSGDPFMAPGAASDRLNAASLSEGAPVEGFEPLRPATARADGSPFPSSAPAAAVSVGSPASSASPAPAATITDGDAAAYSLEASPDDPEFPREMTSRVSLMLREGNREARLQLHPAELGRVQVTINTDGDQARVLFVADSQAAREAIEQAMPRLREALAEQGLELAQADVGQQGTGGEHRAGEQDGIASNRVDDTGGPGADDDRADGSTLTLRSTARLDLYA